MSDPPIVPLGNLMASATGSVNPAAYPDETFDLYSIPAFDVREPEIVRGREVGSSKQIVRPNDVLLSKIVPHIRRSWVVGQDRGRRLIASGEWIVFRSDRVHPAYLRQVLVSDPFHVQFMSTVSGVGGSLLRARPAHVANLQIPLPPVPEQRRIAEVLDHVEALRAKRRATLQYLNILTQSIFLDIFGDPVANPRSLPMAPLRELMTRPFQNGAYFPESQYCVEGGVEMVHMSDAFQGMVRRGTLKRVVPSQRDVAQYSLTSSDLLVARRSLNYSGSVKPCLVPQSDDPLIFESSLIRLTPDEDWVSVLYLYYYLANRRVRERFVFPYVTQATISGINQANLARILVLVPPKCDQDEFARRIRKCEVLRSTHLAAAASLDALFSSLQHRAFRGEL